MLAEQPPYFPPVPDVTGGGDMGALRALEQMYGRHHGEALALAGRLLGDRQLAEDAVQQAFTQIIQSLRSGDDRLLASDSRALVLRNTRWAALRLRWRNRRRATAMSMEINADTDDWVRTEARLLCAAIIDELSPRHSAMLRSRYVEQRADADAARRLGLTVTAYRRRLGRALLAARDVARRIGLVPLLPFALAARALRRVAAPRQRMGVPPLIFGSVARTVGLRVIVAAVWAGLATSVMPWGGVTAPSVSTAASRVPGTQPVATVDEQPDDALLYSVAVAPTPDGAVAAIVALGRGRRCGCAVMFRSRDGGATWEAAPGPEGATQVLLPPAYPSDPRILVSGAAVADFITPLFGRPWETLPLPAGPLALDRGFDAGAPVVYGGSAGTVWSLDLGAPVPRAVAHPLPGTVESIVPGREGGALVLIRPRTHGADGTRLLSCDGHGCGVVNAALPADVTTLTVPFSVRDAGTVLIHGPRRLLVSRDGGRSVAPQTMPVGVVTLISAAASESRIWLVAGTTSGTVLLRRGTGGWIAVGSWAGGGAARIVATRANDLLRLLPYAGMECSRDGGITWRQRCPAGS